MSSITCTTKGWTFWDAIRGMYAKAFKPYTDLGAGTMGSEVVAFAKKYVVIEDTGEPYFNATRKFQGWDILQKELTGSYGDPDLGTAMRVSVVSATQNHACEKPARDYTPEERELACIGLGADGGPVYRIAFEIPS